MKTFICQECGCAFDEPKELSYGIATNGGMATGCPVCGGAYEYAVACNQCGEPFLETELFDGECAECLCNALTPKRGYEYLVSTKIFDDFMFYKIWNCDTPKHTSTALMEHLSDYYMELAAKKPAALKLALERYIFDDQVGMEDFAEWLHGEERNDRPSNAV